MFSSHCRIASKIKLIPFIIKTYDLSAINRFDIKELIHGFVFNQPWQHQQPEITDVSARVKTAIDITEKSDCYHYFPYPCRLILDYHLLKDGLKVQFTVEINGTSEMPFGFGLHPYFSTLGKKDNVTVTLPANSLMESGEDLIPTGKLIEVENTPFDLRKPKQVKELSLDHVFTNIQKEHSAKIEYLEQNITVSLETSPDLTHLVIFTANPEDPFFCLENQTCSTDAINLYNKGYTSESHLLLLSPNQIPHRSHLL